MESPCLILNYSTKYDKPLTKKNGNALGDYAYRLSGSVTRREKNSRLESWAGKILCEVATTDNLQRMG